ncbi:MAG: hypothetical protein WKF84_01905 [Pyrinomonadaceae bacterium]
MIGALLGAFLYDLFIRDVLVARHEIATEDVETKGETVKERPVAAIEEF